MHKKILAVSALTLALLLVVPGFASAHVTVKPDEVNVGQRLNFIVSVPTEETVPTIQVRLVIPEGVASVRPNVKPGWNIELKKTGEGENLRVSEIIWSGGKVPAEQRDEFIFSAQAPAEEKTVVWKAYQTYEGGHVVAWENSPEVIAEYTKKNPPKPGEDDHSAPRPYSQTKVIDDLSTSVPAGTTTSESSADSSNNNTTALVVSVIALVVSITSMMRMRAK